jgi:antitoxin HicB
VILPKNAYTIRELTDDEGGGFYVSFPELPGCASDGESVEEALANAADAEKAWVAANKKWSDSVAKKFVTRFPRSLYVDLSSRAKKDGVSMNTMVLTLVARGIDQQRA